MVQYLKVLKSYRSMPLGMAQYLAKNIHRVTVSKGSRIDENTFKGHIYFIESGLIVQTDRGKGDKELYVRWFKKENEFIIDYRKVSDQKFSYCYDLTAVENCVLWVISEKASEYLSGHYHDFARYCSIVTSHDEILYAENRLLISLQSPEGAYDFVKGRRPDLLERVPMKYLAPYMHISERALIRVMKKNAKSKVPVKRLRLKGKHLLN